MRVWTVAFFHLNEATGPEVNVVAKNVQHALRKAMHWLKREYQPSDPADYDVRSVVAGLEVEP